MLATLAGWLAALQVPAPPEPAVEWTAPPECPARAEVIAAIDRRLGRSLAPDEAVVAGRVSRDGRRGFTLRLRLTAGERGETRELSDRSCAALADAVAVLVAAAVEPGGAAAIVPEPAAPEPEPESEPAALESAPESAPGPEDAPIVTPGEEPRPAAPVGEPLASDNVFSDRSKRPGGFVRAHGGLEFGAVPRTSGAVALAGGVLWRRWRLELQGTFVAPQTHRDGLTPVRAWLVAGSIAGCYRLGRRALEVPLCLGVEGGTIHGEARAWPSGRAAFQGWLAALATAGLAWHAGARWSLWASLQLIAAPVRPRFQLSDPGPPTPRTVELWGPSPVSGRLLLGVEFRFGDPW